MRRAAILGLVVASTATAKPLPKGMKVTLVKGSVMVSQGGATVPLTKWSYPTKKLTSAELTDDGKSIAIVTDRCDNIFGDADEPFLVPLAPTEAVIENVLGMQQHTKKKYAEAIAHFTLAVAKDPDTPVYATNLLSAQSMSGKLDDADKVLADQGKRAAPWFAWRLAVDPELKAVKTRPAAKLDAPKPGTAKGSLAGKLAYSPLGFVATELDDGGSDGTPDGSSDYELVIASIATGKEVLRLPTETTCGMDMMTGAADKKCEKREAAKTAAKRKLTDALLAQLGFDEVKGAYSDERDATQLTAADGRKLAIGDDKAKLTHGKKTTEIAWDHRPWAMGFVPAALAVIDRHKDVLDCSGTGVYSLTLSAIPTP